MEGSLRDLAQYRLDVAKEDLARAKREFEIADYKLATNRSYYAIFHAIRAVNSLDGFDSSKHSGVIGHFNHEHVKNGDFPKNVSKRIKDSMEIRQKSDYDDFYIVSIEQAKVQIESAEYIIDLVEKYLTRTNK